MLSEIVHLDKYISNEYLLALTVLVVSFLVFRLLLALAHKFFVNVTSKTKTDVDDILLAKSSNPLNLVALLLSLLLALPELSLAEVAMLNTTRAIYSALVLTVAYLVFIFVDVALVVAWKNLAKKTRVPINESVSNLVHEVLKIVLIIISVLYILDIWGVEILPVLGALGVAGLAVALALQPVLSNIFSGISVVMDKSVKVGDWIILGDGTWGIIDKIGIRSTKIKTFDQDMIIVPNTKLADSEIRNVSLPAKIVRKVIPFSVAYGSDVERVKKVVLNELKKVKYVVKEPEPSVKFLEMGGSSLNFKAFFFIESYEFGYTAVDDANTRIYDALNKAGISIPFPQLDVHLKGRK